MSVLGGMVRGGLWSELRNVVSLEIDERSICYLLSLSFLDRSCHPVALQSRIFSAATARQRGRHYRIHRKITCRANVKKKRKRAEPNRNARKEKKKKPVMI